MADRGLINTEYLSDIADAIRSKAGTSNTYKPTEMADAINNLNAKNFINGTETTGTVSSGSTISAGDFVLEQNSSTITSDINLNNTVRYSNDGCPCKISDGIYVVPHGNTNTATLFYSIIKYDISNNSLSKLYESYISTSSSYLSIAGAYSAGIDNYFFIIYGYGNSNYTNQISLFYWNGSSVTTIKTYSLSTRGYVSTVRKINNVFWLVIIYTYDTDYNYNYVYLDRISLTNISSSGFTTAECVSSPIALSSSLGGAGGYCLTTDNENNAAFMYNGNLYTSPTYWLVIGTYSNSSISLSSYQKSESITKYCYNGYMLNDSSYAMLAYSNSDSTIYAYIYNSSGTKTNSYSFSVPYCTNYQLDRTIMDQSVSNKAIFYIANDNGDLLKIEIPTNTSSPTVSIKTLLSSYATTSFSREDLNHIIFCWSEATSSGSSSYYCKCKGCTINSGYIKATSTATGVALSDGSSGETINIIAI